MPAYDPSKLRPQRDWVSILMEERRVQLDSGLFLPTKETGVEKVTEGAGVIIRVGPGELNKTLDLAPGQRVLVRSYFKYANYIETDETWPSGAKKEYFFMSSKDIMALIPKEADVGVFSRPAMSAVDKVDEEGNVEMR